MKIRTVALILFVSIATAWADDKIASVQQALKDQGFYYGEITGEKNADTAAAIRRFQIRNGLQVSGDLNDETLRALRSGAASASASTSSATPTPAIARPASPAPPPDNSDFRDNTSGDENVPDARQPYVAPRPGRPVDPLNPGEVTTTIGRSFAGTPYADAPPEVQRDVILNAQKTLARQGLYRGVIDGGFGPDMEFSLRAYQARVGLPTTGRLDLQTLAALELLPGPEVRGRIYRPRRVYREPPVRGEWIRP
jgi:peptidoglycan hydrolase-like protein with peptidoglycan-binding domain